ncbi:hypothetical protein ALC56_10711 [Trachymyrmex septentrionalis]|uniref:Uncharacterized protein n=1 Tax=Trachymyrmex septentrionalis TaxID=34720 RepID=A0A195F4H4_9HYME|nr:hypothetical protein ALC56_10711 [Trachymyrmex septentrionalis]
MWGRSLPKVTKIPEISPEIHFRNFNKQRYNMGQYKGCSAKQDSKGRRVMRLLTVDHTRVVNPPACLAIIARDSASLVVSKLRKKSRVALRRSRKKQNVIQCPTCASGQNALARSHSGAPSAPSAASNRVKEAPASYVKFTINVVSCIMETVLNYHASILHEGTFQQISQDTGVYRWLAEKAETFGARYPPAGAASQTAKLDATHNTGSTISLWYYFGHVMELTRSTGTKRCILSRQIPLWYQQQRENKYLIERTNGPKPKLIDPPIQENGINIKHMQMLKKRAIMMRNL